MHFCILKAVLEGNMLPRTLFDPRKVATKKGPANINKVKWYKTVLSFEHSLFILS